MDSSRLAIILAVIALGGPMLAMIGSVIVKWMEYRVKGPGEPKEEEAVPAPVGIVPTDHILGRIVDLKEQVTYWQAEAKKADERGENEHRRADRYMVERNAAWDQLRALGHQPLFRFDGRVVPSVLPDSHPEEHQHSEG